MLFIQTSGDEMGAAPAIAEVEVQPGQDYVWEVSFKAPTKTGKYTAFFRQATSNNIRFGHKVWCDIQVEEPEVGVLLSASSSGLKKTPKELYFDMVAGAEAVYQPNMTQLYECGYTNFHDNLAILKRHQNNVELTLNELLDL